MARPIVLQPRAPAASVDALLAGVSAREAMAPGDSLSSASLERVVKDGERFVVKYLHYDDDWIMRATGDLRCRPAMLWQAGLLDALPPEIDTTIVDVATGLGRHGWGAAVLMRDVGPHLVPEGDGVVPFDQHRRFLAHMAALHAAFWDSPADVELAPHFARWCLFNPHLPVIERALGNSGGVPSVVAGGWEALRALNPGLGALVDDLFADPGPLFEAVAPLPVTLVHSDWKFGNLGSLPGPDGTPGAGATVLLDWAFPGWAPPAADLAWYLAVNCRRLPEAKEDAIDAYRRALVVCGIDPEPDWDAHLGLALIGAFLQLGWSKAMDGPDDEYRWWEQRVLEATRYLA